jgi:TetR/AcrR family transcriptional regulator, transcriptional repressor for nem operon
MTDSVEPQGVSVARATAPAASATLATGGGRARAAGKRQRLIDAACQVCYAQGVERTTLADVAAAAGIPLGNVYYYFKTKNDLIGAVVEAHLSEARAMLAKVEAAHDDPLGRLKALFGAFAAQSAEIARYGCPQGSLCAELDKLPGGPGPAAELMRVPLDWAERQFSALGRADARDLAVEVIARYQGSALLASTLRDPDLLTRESARVAAWLDALGA